MKESRSNMFLLKFINENPGLTQLEIVEKTKISKSGVSIFVKNAKKENYILEIKKEKKVKIHPTKLGKDIMLKSIVNDLIGRL